jgi:hypothetical protein
VKNYIIKKFSSINEVQLYQFYKKVYRNIDKTFIKNIRWQYRIGYNQFEPIVIIVENKIIGHAGLIPGEIENQGQKYPVIWGSDFDILPEFRSRGYGKILTNEWMKICPNQISFGNNLSFGLFKRLNWKTNFSTIRKIYPINYFKITPIIKNFGLNIGNNFIRYFLKKNLKDKKLIKPEKISKTIIQNFIKFKKEEKSISVYISRDESWFNWRLIESPYKNDIYFFEDNDEFVIGRIFYQNKIKRLNVLYTNAINSEQSIFKLLLKWSIENEIDFIWHITNSSKDSNQLFSTIYKKKMNFAFNTSNIILSQVLEKGLINTQGIDSDIDSIARER